MREYLDSIEKAIMSFRKLGKAMNILEDDVSRLKFSLKKMMSKFNLKDLQIEDGIINVEPLSSSRGIG